MTGPVLGLLPGFDYAAAWDVVAYLFDDAECPPALRHRALTELPPAGWGGGGSPAAGGGPALAYPVDEVSQQPALARLTARQHDDGGFGDRPEPARRILPTLWALRSLTDLGAAATGGAWARAAGFLVRTAQVEGGFAVDGRPTGVLSCYTGLFTSLLGAGRAGLRAAGADLPGPLSRAHAAGLDWLVAHQQVGYRGASYRATSPVVWGDYLAHRYGGCFAATSCLTGVVRAGQALADAIAAPDHHAGDAAAAVDPAADRGAVLSAIRQYLLDRSLFRRSDGRPIPLGVAADAPEDKASAWLAVTYPLLYHVDLLEVLDLVARAGPADLRLAPAVGIVLGHRLPDGAWPLQRRARHELLHAPEPVARRRPSRWGTFRAMRALRGLYSPD